MKICTKCKKEKSLDNFSKNKNNKDGFQVYCKECFNKNNLIYHKNNKEKKKKYAKQYALKNKEKSQKYYQDHKLQILKRQTTYNLKNKENKSQYDKIYNSLEENKIRKYKLAKKWREENKEHIRERNRKYMKTYRIISFNCKLRENISHYIRKYLTQNLSYKKDCTEKYLGCSLEEYKLYLENLFTPEMSWENYGRYGYWEIDHIKPTSSFDLTKEEEILKAFHYLNTQPLPIIENRIKSNKW